MKLQSRWVRMVPSSSYLFYTGVLSTYYDNNLQHNTTTNGEIKENNLSLSQGNLFIYLQTTVEELFLRQYIYT